jgi:hypothetical protein
MARIRTIKPEAFASESLAKVSIAAERTFWGLTTQVDDAGRLRDNAAVIAGALWSLRPEHTPVHVEQDLQDLAANDELICRYTGCDGKQYLHMPSWLRHQKINRPSVPRTAACRAHEPKAVCGVCETTDCKSERRLTEPSVSPHGALSESSVSPHGGSEEPAGQPQFSEGSLSPHGGLTEGSLTDLVPSTWTVDLGPSSEVLDQSHQCAREANGLSPEGQWQPSQIARELAAEDIARLGPDGTLEVTRKFVNNRRITGRTPDDVEWLSWMANEKAEPLPEVEETWTPPRFRSWSEYEDAPPGRDPDEPPHLSVVPDPEPPLPADEARALTRSAAHAAKHGTADTA